MPRLIVQADDIAITHGTTLGILDAITDGIVRATGIFTNRPDAAFAAERLRELEGVDVGIDLNFVTGRPLLPTGRVPDLVNADGAFRSSGQIRMAFHAAHTADLVTAFEREPFDAEQTLAEAHAQVDRFVELMGRPPAYVHPHSLVSAASDEVVRQVGAELGVPYVDDLYRDGTIPLLPNDWYATPFPWEAQAAADAVGALKRMLPAITSNDLSLLIVHPGYVDAEILEVSTYSIIRARDLELVTAPESRLLLRDAGVEIVSFSGAGLL
ncbi:MAG: ChbG/HpnK family deacetylase [Microbacterium sp.]|uniref:ChbG/HpnK family deacetylase n=1 Tax=Microbacterium sp. TaxID=51671 RepID=UPI001AD3A510|nr:ChbG/HpnK family deacetylase [Microbacterium sp.]MBN9177414.1 ChbG/HpnK family deacetylase [Microbacterium sp.]